MTGGKTLVTKYENMTKRRRGAGRRGAQKKNPSKTLQTLESIKNYERASLRNAEMYKLDVPFTHIKRKKVHQFARNYAFSVLTMPTAVDTLGAIATSLSLLPNNTEFTALFDEYRITMIKVNWEPFMGVFAPVWTVIDYDDSINPASINALRQYDTLKVISGGSFFERIYVPRIAVAAYSGAFTSFSNQGGLWIDAASPTVQYYGLKYALQADAASTGKWDVSLDVIIQCRSTI